MRVALAIVVPLVAALLQGSLVPFITVAGARPNLVVLVAACSAIAAGAREGVWWAFAGGIASDLLSGGPLGAGALSALIPVAAAGVGDPVLRPRSVITGALIVAAATGAAAVLYALVLAVSGVTVPDLAAVIAGAVGASAYNGALAIATYPLFRMARRTGEKQASFGW